MNEEVLQQEVQVLRERLERAEFDARKAHEDEIEKLKNENEHLHSVIDGRLVNIQAGDVLLCDTQSVLHNNPAIWMQLAKKFSCIFVSLPAGGKDAMTTMTNEELKALGLRKLDSSEKTTAHERVKSLSIELETAMVTEPDSATADRKSHLFNAHRALKAAESAILWLEQNKPEPVETHVPPGAMLGG